MILLETLLGTHPFEGLSDARIIRGLTLGGVARLFRPEDIRIPLRGSDNGRKPRPLLLRLRISGLERSDRNEHPLYRMMEPNAMAVFRYTSLYMWAAAGFAAMDIFYLYRTRKNAGLLPRERESYVARE